LSVNSRLRVRFERRDSTTVLHVDEQQPPLQVVRAFPSEDAETLVHLHNISGGILADDQLEVNVCVGPHSRAQITSTGATRIYRSDESSAQRISMCVGENALLEYLPDPLIPYAGSRYSQTTEIELANGASLFWWEVLTPGRFSAGEVFAYEKLHIRNVIRAGDRAIAHENYVLVPAQSMLEALARFGPHTHLASFYACRIGYLPGFWREIERSLAEIASSLTERNRILWGVSALSADGVAVRGLSATGEELAGHLREFWRAAKRLITGHEAVVPRKTL